MSVTSADRLLAPAVAETLDALDLGPLDAGAARLACRMATQIDDAARAERAADKVLERLIDAGYSEEDSLFDEVTALRQKMAARLAVTDLGPKLLAVLVELGATPKARAQIAKLTPQTGRGAPSAASRALASVRGDRGA